MGGIIRFILAPPMKRAAPILLAILLGAAATALGMGIFLKLANDDRARLANDLNRAHAEAAAALSDKQKIADEANQKVSAANGEVTKAQNVMKALEEEQRLLADAKQLQKPPARDTRTWQTTVSLPLGISVLLPPKTEVEMNDAQGLTAVKPSASSSTIPDLRWLSITPYNAETAAELSDSLATSTDVAYLIDGRLLTGKTGKLAGDGNVAIFQVRQAASSTHLIWIKDPGTFGTGNGFERFLATFEFAN
jgi:hypothetical protein